MCTCERSEHYGWCPSNCCVPIECSNYKFCDQKVPQWILETNNGMCSKCYTEFGKVKITDEIDECHICTEYKAMLILKCGHKICNDCWCQIIGIDNNNCYLNNHGLCPICHNINNHQFDTIYF